MDLFNRKKVAQLQEELENAHSTCKKLHEYNGKMIDTISMMDDEILQVAKARYFHKYIKYRDNDDHFMKVVDVGCSRGMVRLTGDNGLMWIWPLSHLKNTVTVITKKEYLEATV